MSIITLTSDYGIVDHDVAALKGDIWRESPEAKVIDISHGVEPYNIMQAAYLVRRTYPHYPAGSIHLMLVDAQQSTESNYLLAVIDDQYFLAPDNGILTLIADERSFDQLIALDLRNSEGISDAHAVYARICGHLLRGGKPSVLGQAAKNYVEKTPSRPTLRPDGSEIIGHVIHIDTFGNLVTNISRRWLKDNVGNKRMSIMVRNKRLKEIFESYYEGPTEGNVFAVFNSDGLMEIAVQKPGGKYVNSACSLLGLQVNSNIFIEIQ